MKKINYRPTLFLICLLFLIVACKKEKEHIVVGESITANTPVTSVVESSDVEISEGNNAFLRGDFNGAIKYYENGLKQNRSVAYYNMGVSYYMMKDIANAEVSFRNAVQESPYFEEAVMNLAAVLAEQEKSVEAEELLTRIVNTKKTARVYVDMANLSIKNNNSAKASFYYEKAFVIDNESDFVLSNYANFLISIGELDEGERILNLLDNKDFAVMYNLAYLEWVRGNKEEAYSKAIQAFDVNNTSDEGNNKLATLFSKMRQYYYEAETLRRLIMWNPKKEYRIRLVDSYLHSLDLNKAEDEVTQLLADLPNDDEVIVEYYNVMIARGMVPPAGQFIKAHLEKLPDSDLLFYSVVRHICLYEANPMVAEQMIARNKKNTPYAQLARVAFHSRMMQLPEAKAVLATIPPSAHNDYYIYKTFYQFKDGLIQEADKTAKLISESRSEYFWYNLALAWNLKQSDRITELLKVFKDDYIVTLRVPRFGFKLTPVGADMPFIYKFDNTPADIAGTLLYPFFIEPDEMFPFLAVGYKLLKDSDYESAISELNRSLIHSDAININNQAITKLLNYEYESATELLHSIEDKIPMNPFLHYNLGLVYYLNGDTELALEYFNRAIRLNRYLAPAYIGRGLAYDRMGDYSDASDSYEGAIFNAEEYLNLTDYSVNIMLPMIKRARQIAYIAQNRPERVIAQFDNETNPDNYIKGMKLLAEYLITPQDTRKLKAFTESNIYKSHELGYLMELSNKPLSEISERPFKDLNTVMAAKYIMAQRKRTLTNDYLAPLINKQRVMVAMVNLATLLRQQELGIQYLKYLGNIDIRYIQQYKAAFYFFMWTGDRVNTEATFGTIARMNKYDKDTQYYMMLYSLINYNQQRLADIIQHYVSAYPWDYRGALVMVFQQMKDENYRGFLTQLGALMQRDPFLFNKMPLEIDFERF